jgi:hypothetical protein
MAYSKGIFAPHISFFEKIEHIHTFNLYLQEAEKMSEPWTCPVCFYNRDEVAGIVEPSCRHTICLPCYSQIRDGNVDPVCVLCRTVYWQRPPNMYAPVPASAYESTDYNWQVAQPSASELAAARLVPFLELTPNQLRAIRPLAVDPNRRNLRQQDRLRVKTPMHSLTYSQKLNILRVPAVEANTATVVAPAAFISNTSRILQARILGLQKASEAQRTQKAEKAAARLATKGARAGAGAADNVDARIDATKVFYGIKPPTRKFRIDDIHQPPTGAMGVCKGFHVWHYQDGKIIRKGVVIIPAPAPVPVV